MPSDLLTLLNSAYEKARAGRYIDALNDFELILSHDPRHQDALFGAAACHYRLENDDTAHQLLTRLLERNPRHKKGQELLAVIEQKQLNQVSRPLKEDPFRIRTEPLRGGAQKKVDPIPEWSLLNPVEKTWKDELEEARKIQPGELNLQECFRTAKQNIRERRSFFLLAAWVAFVIQLFTTVVSLSILIQSIKLRAILPKIVDILFYQFFVIIFCGSCLAFAIGNWGMNTWFCIQLHDRKDLPVRYQKNYFEYIPYLTLGNMVVWIPTLIWLSLRLIVGLEVPLPIPVQWSPLYLFTCLSICVQVYLVIRFWFLNQVISVDECSWREGLFRAWYGTRGQFVPVCCFAIYQCVWLLLGILSLGYLLPVINQSQAVAFIQLYRLKFPLPRINTDEQKIEWFRKRWGSS